MSRRSSLTSSDNDGEESVFEDDLAIQKKAKSETKKQTPAKRAKSTLSSKKAAGKKKTTKKKKTSAASSKKKKTSAPKKSSNAAKAKQASSSLEKTKKSATAAVKNDDEEEECCKEMDEDSGEHKWWEQREKDENGDEDAELMSSIKGDGTIKWQSLEHAGPYFPPPYEPIGVPLLYDGQELHLEPPAEEVAGFFAALLKSDHAANEIFCRNFFDDFRQVLRDSRSKHADRICEFTRCDFSHMHAHFEEQRELKKRAGKDQKEEAKRAKAAVDEKHGIALLDGHQEKVGNFRIEPPGLFRGRGKHPKAGKLKLRVLPEQVTINIGRGVAVPEPPSGHSWASIQHDSTVTWLATWTENVNRQQKYVFLAPGSSLKGASDLKKFETARHLKAVVGEIRARNATELESKEMAVRQRATALWLIDHLALRAGNEKGDDEADTVGCCSLRCEHVRLNPASNTVIFDFLGKDSIRYHREVQVGEQIIKNLALFMKSPKTPSDPIFDRLSTASLNKYLSELMPGLTAKVFRTFNASQTFQKELDAGTPRNEDASTADLVLAYNRANRQVAVLCNHQRAVPKTHDQAMERLREKILGLKYSRWVISQELLKRRRGGKKLAKNDDEEMLSDFEPETVQTLLLQRHAEAQAKKRSKKQDAKESDESDEASESANPIEDLRLKTEKASDEVLQKRLATLDQRLAAMRIQRTDRDENKTTSLGTSKTNYLDPRITVAWCARSGVPVERMFNKSLREKFKWAMGVDASWSF